jgi:hypothetical protein
MIATTDTGANEVYLDADPAGYGWGRFYRTLPTVPAGTKRALIAFRAYFDTFAADDTYTSKGWNPTNYLGLGFTTDDWEMDAASMATQIPPDLFGWATTGVNILSGGNVATAGRMTQLLGGSPSVRIARPSAGPTSSYSRRLDFCNGLGASVFGEQAWNIGSAHQQNLCLPANPTDGALFTGYFDIWASSLNKTVYAKIGMNFGGLTGTDMFNAPATPWNSTNYQWTLHGDVVSAYRPDIDTFVVPNVLKGKFAHYTQRMVVKEIRRRFYDWDNTVVGED